MAIEVTDTNFQAEVIESEETTLVDFWAPWCGPCRALSPILDEIDGERSDVRVVKLNTDDNQQMAAKYGIMSLPTMIVFRNGMPIGQISGAMPKPRLNAELDRMLN